MYSQFAILASLSSLAAAASSVTGPVSMFPVTTQTHFDSPRCTGNAAAKTQEFTVNYNFETFVGDTESATSPVGEYNLLNFNNINFVDTDPDQDGNHLGVSPHTYPNGAVLSSNTSASVLSPLDTTIPLITANYTESTLTSFTPNSFWYGCVADFPYSAGSLPANCTIKATSFNAKGKTLATQTFAFTANGSVVQDQNHGVFHPGFASSYSLAFQIVHSGLFPASALIDNFIATLTQQACAPFYTGSYNNGT